MAALPGGIAGIETAAGAPAVHRDRVRPCPGPPREDERRRQARKDAGVTAILHETLPVRYWDHDLGPDDLRLFVRRRAQDRAAAQGPDAGRGPGPCRAGGGAEPGRHAVATGWWQWRDGVQAYSELVAIDVAAGQRTVVSRLDRPNQLAGGADVDGDPGSTTSDPVYAPDGERIVCVRGAP